MATPTPSTWDEKLREASDTAARATRYELSKAYSQAFQAYLRAGQLYLWLVRNIPPPRHAERDRLKRTAQRVMQRAQTIKSLCPDLPLPLTLTHEQQSLTLQSAARIHGTTFPPWNTPTHHQYTHPARFVDPDGQPRLSPDQINNHARYASPSPSPSASASASAFATPLRGHDIVQDIVTDCSFVAALEVAAEHDYRWRTQLATSALYPKDPKDPSGSRILPSPNGRYDVRLLLNGIPRCVTIDDSLPSYPDGRLMCATSRTGQHAWPALLEKAYLKVMGGYHFPGSNSSVDLHALTGWIPEHVFLRHAGFQREKMWSRILHAWSHGQCMITAGTGSNSSGGGLIPSHDYAVLELIESQSRRYVKLMNPWRRGARERPGLAVPIEEEQSVLRDQEQGRPDPDPDPDPCFLVSWDDLATHFDSIYLNWDPSRLTHQLSVHATCSAQAAVHVGQSPQFRLTASAEVWLLLVRHIPLTRAGYMALHVFENHAAAAAAAGARMYKPLTGGRYVDGTHTLVRTTPGTGTGTGTYTVIVSADVEMGYTLTAFSAAPLSLTELPHAYAFTETLRGEWTPRSAGGNITHPSFMHNPQYALAIDAPTSLLLLLEAPRQLAVHVQILWSSATAGARAGTRIDHATDGDVALSSGMYNHALAVAQGSLQPGTYTLVLSTFQPGQTAPFSLRVQSDRPLKLTPIPAEGAGMFSRSLTAPAARLAVPKPARFIFRLKSSSPANAARVRPYLQLNVATHPAGQRVASSGPFVDHVCGAAIHDIRLEPGQYTLSPATYSTPAPDTRFTIDVYSDCPIDVTPVPVPVPVPVAE